MFSAAKYDRFDQCRNVSQPHQLYRSGLLDLTSRVSVNLKGGPSMPAEEFRSWRQKTLLGVSLKILAPTGQYDPTNW
jgi:hypothetical protein